MFGWLLPKDSWGFQEKHCWYLLALAVLSLKSDICPLRNDQRKKKASSSTNPLPQVWALTCATGSAGTPKQEQEVTQSPYTQPSASYLSRLHLIADTPFPWKPKLSKNKFFTFINPNILHFTAGWQNQGSFPYFTLLKKLTDRKPSILLSLLLTWHSRYVN